MSDTPNPAPAGAEAPRSPAPTVSILDAMGDSDFGKPSEPEGDDVPQEVEEVEIEPAPEPEGDDAEIPSDDENEEPADDAAEPPAKEADTEDDETGTRMHRLRDGTQVSLGDLKKAYDEARGYRQAVPQFQQERARLEQEKQAIAAERQQIQQILADVAEDITTQLPKKPDRSLKDSDIIAYIEQMDDYNYAMEQFQQKQGQRVQQRQALEQQQTARQQAAHQAYLQDQQQKLAQALPVLRDPVKAKAFAEGWNKVGQHAGFSPQELGQVYDHRLMLVGDLAIDGLKYREEKAAKAKVTTEKSAIAAKKVVDKPPVQAPAARQAAGVREAQAARGAMDRLKKTGSPRDAEDVLSRFL